MLIAGCKMLCRAVALALFGVLLLVVAGLGACTPYQVSDRSMSFNDSLGDLDNRQVLLNAVRASKRYPPYYTAVGGITSTGELDGSQINFSLPFGPISHSNNSASPMIKVGTGITMTTNPLDTQDFYEGYMQPIKTDLVGYYLDYGWPTQVIIHAFLREIDLPRDIVEAIKVRLRQVLVSQGLSDCTGRGGFAECLHDRLSDPDLLAKMSLPENDPRSLQNCKSLSGLNALTAGERTPPGVDNSLPEAYTAAAKEGNEIIRFINEPAKSCQFATFQLLSAMLDKLELTVVPVSTRSGNAAKPITVPTSQAGLSIKIQNDAASSGTAKTAFALNKVMDPCVLQTGDPTAARLAAKIAAAGPDIVAPNPTILRTKGEPVTTDSAAPAEPAAPAPHPAKPGPVPAKQTGEPVAPTVVAPGAPTPSAASLAPAKPAAPPVKPAAKPAKAKALEPWHTLCTDEAQVQVVPRSPEAIVFYLGEMIEREYPEPGKEPEILTVYGGAPKPYALFHVIKGGAPGPDEVSVSLDGETYSIPRGEDFRSTMHMLTLTEQIIGLQKKGTQTPGIVPVQVINP
jgi:hypothetical protein